MDSTFFKLLSLIFKIQTTLIKSYRCTLPALTQKILLALGVNSVQCWKHLKVT